MEESEGDSGEEQERGASRRGNATEQSQRRLVQIEEEFEEDEDWAEGSNQ